MRGPFTSSSKERPQVLSVEELLKNGSTPRSDWSISGILAIELEAYLERVRPKRILEVGSGLSTAVLAAYAVRCGAEVVTLEHLRKYNQITAQGLRSLGLNGSVDLRLAPLRLQPFGNKGPYQWYDVSFDRKEFDFVFVDGPPKAMGRRGVFFALREHLRPGWQMWLDDGLRRHERQCIKLWEQEFPGEFSWDRLDIDGKGVFILHDACSETDLGVKKAIRVKLAVGVVGNGDSNWWRRVRRNVGDELLASSHVAVTARDATPASSLPRFVNSRIPAKGRPLAQRVQEMLRELAGQAGVRYVLYLDDQWMPRTLDAGWLSRALEFMELRPNIDWMTLEHRADAGGGLDGLALDGTVGSGSTPFTGAPSLLRADRLTKRRWRQARSWPGFRLLPRSSPFTVDLSYPGVFRRIDVQGRPERLT